MKKLGGIDASFLYMETPETPMHVAGLTLIELPAGCSGSFYAVQSYCGSLDFGFTACRRTVPDIRKLGDFHVDALRELSEAFPAEARSAKAPQAELRP